MNLLLILAASLALVAGQRRNKPTPARNTEDTDGYYDERNCAAPDFEERTTAHDGWQCLCNQLNLERENCEKNAERIAQKHNLKVCTDKPNYYLGKDNKCLYESLVESSSDPAGKALQFAIDLFRAADPQDPTKNFIISPLSPQILLAQLTDGCSEPARVELVRALQLNSGEATALAAAMVEATRKDSSLNKLDIASIFFKSVNMQLTDQFNRERKDNKIQMRDVDFSNTAEAVRTINDWVNTATRGKIPEIVTDANLSPDLSMMLLNAIYFRGTWQFRFNETDKRGQFRTSKQGTRMPVYMMSQVNKLRFGELNFDGYYSPTRGMRWVELPYDGDELSMIFMLPKQQYKLEETLQQINSTHLKSIFSRIGDNYNPTKIHLKVPKFTIRDSVALVEPLKKLGIRRIFEDDTALSRLSKTPTKVGDVKQEAYLSVDESGTTATAVSKITIIPLSVGPPDDMDFICDEPFVVMIVDKTRQIPLFMAKVNKPLKPERN